MKDFLELAKPRIAVMVMITAAVGYWLAGGTSWAILFWTLLGTGLSSAAAGTLNQYIERDLDALMRRTAARPIPAGRVEPSEALAFGLLCGIFGGVILLNFVNTLAFSVTLFTLLSYVLAYTPLKTRTPQSTWIGAISGATPPLIGWAAASGTLGPEAWALFTIQFLWQIPHFLALFWIHREDYARAGYKVMPVVDPNGGATALQIAIHSFALLPASLMPTMTGMAGVGYGYLALGLSGAFLGMGVRASFTMSSADHKRLFLASLAYLPVIFGALVIAGHRG